MQSESISSQIEVLKRQSAASDSAVLPPRKKARTADEQKAIDAWKRLKPSDILWNQVPCFEWFFHHGACDGADGAKCTVGSFPHAHSLTSGQLKALRAWIRKHPSPEPGWH